MVDGEVTASEAMVLNIITACSPGEMEYIQDIYDKRLANAPDNFWGWYHPMPYTKYDKEIAHKWWINHPDERPTFNQAVKWGVFN